MAINRFVSARLTNDVITLEFTLEDRKHPLSVTLRLHEVNQLTAGLLNALRAAEQQGSQVPPLELGQGRAVNIQVLPVDQWQVNTSPQFPGQKILHLLAAGGLYLTFGLDANAARFAGEALAGAVGETPTESRN